MNRDFFYDIKTENPLVTILKNGMIPVISICFDEENKKFKNSSLFSFLEKLNSNWVDLNNKNNYGIDFEKLPDEGTFVYIGGIKGGGNSFDDTFYGIKIGAVDPNAMVLNTYTYKNSKSIPLEKVSALDKYRECLEIFSKLKEKEDSFNDKEAFFDFLSNIDDYSRVIIDANLISNYLYIPAKDFCYLFDTSFDEFLGLTNFEILFESAFEGKGIPLEVLSSWGVNYSEYLDGSTRFEIVDSILYKYVKKEIAIKSIKEYVESGKVKTFLSDYSKDLDNLYANFKYGKIEKLECYSENNFSINLFSLGYPPRGIHFNVYKDNINVDYNTYESKEIVYLNDLLKDENRSHTFIATKAYMDYVNIIRKYLPDFKYSKTVEMIYQLCLLEENIKTNTFYSTEFKDIRIWFDDNFNMIIKPNYIFTIKYNYVLDDFIFELGDICCNFENFPEEYKDVYDYYDLDDNYYALETTINTSEFFNNDYKSKFLDKLITKTLIKKEEERK